MVIRGILFAVFLGSIVMVAKYAYKLPSVHQNVSIFSQSLAVAFENNRNIVLGYITGQLPTLLSICILLATGLVLISLFLRVF